MDGREFIRSAPLQVWTRPFDPLPPPKPSLRQQEKESRRRREAAKRAKEDGSVVLDVTEQFESLKVGESSASGAAAAAALATSTSNTIDKEEVSVSTSADEPTARTISHFVMNLPGSALEFLDACNGCYKPLLSQPDFPGVDAIDMPHIHVHCFSKEAEGEAATNDLCKASPMSMHDLQTNPYFRY